jgi:hypothetical protein
VAPIVAPSLLSADIIIDCPNVKGIEINPISSIGQSGRPANQTLTSFSETGGYLFVIVEFAQPQIRVISARVLSKFRTDVLILNFCMFLSFHKFLPVSNLNLFPYPLSL